MPAIFEMIAETIVEIIGILVAWVAGMTVEAKLENEAEKHFKHGE